MKVYVRGENRCFNKKSIMFAHKETFIRNFLIHHKRDELRSLFYNLQKDGNQEDALTKLRN